jgi:hypothetical protein
MKTNPAAHLKHFFQFSEINDFVETARWTAETNVMLSIAPHVILLTVTDNLTVIYGQKMSRNENSGALRQSGCCGRTSYCWPQ